MHLNSNVLFAADPPVGSGVPKHASLAFVPSQAKVPVLTLATDAAKNMYIKMHPRVDWRLSKNNSGRYPQSRQNGTCDQSGDKIAMLLQAVSCGRSAPGAHLLPYKDAICSTLVT